ncbi:UDP-N-acetylmuramoyl-tripeptide--D-alanyl-D-alanine ligase [bacterium endosymbiont of Pedicinus badii]|uniref:UDP-N-acetylmuramoyl-tripeptide--D-alanyl-D- alanine ligase n=1 Tax=bacterium endosymbiont of Pedicinus badii TaxID=1719126 RepID=UPI0009BC4411|nr:UDP-N-acetylmuramoyl-tripeptide--D-alanyl-D-alanine ligase [bacterium endosymbiont of Pedicinus badii]OQM34216.1 hypothetical protein AOQ89_02690 [bacterium endosymbiont of Pedicinus badii]
MIKFSLEEISYTVDGELFGKNTLIEEISINSKNIKKNRNFLFIAVKGEKKDGHDYIKEAIYMGAKAIISEKIIKFSIPYILVSSTKNAICRITKKILHKTGIKIIAITGSSGKTSVKEISNFILKNEKKSIATKKNFNNKIGIFLSVLRIKKNHKIIILEIGANHFKEILEIRKFISPNIVVINNIHHSHILGFKNISGVAKAKSEILKNLSKDTKVVLNADSANLQKWKKYLKNKKVFMFSIKKKSDFFAKKIKISQFSINFVLYVKNKKYTVFIPIIGGLHSVSNVLAAVAICYLCDVKMQKIIFYLRYLKPVPNRLFPIFLKKKFLILDDTYNANFESVISSLDVLNRFSRKKIFIFGDMKELGEYKYILHKKIGMYLLKKNINLVFTLGKLSNLVSMWHKNGMHFTKREELLKNLLIKLKNFSNFVILIKGSRKMKMEKIVEFLKNWIQNE